MKRKQINRNWLIKRKVLYLVRIIHNLYFIDDDRKLNKKLHMLSDLNSKRRSRSKNRESREQIENNPSDSDYNKQTPEPIDINIQKLSINEKRYSKGRPFSGGQIKPQKTWLKQTNIRPKTAKKLIKSSDKELKKSPSSIKFLSPKSSKKTLQHNKQIKSTKSKKKKSTTSSK